MRFITEDKKMNDLLSELLSEIPAARGLDIDVCLERCDEGLSVWQDAEGWHMAYSTLSSLWRGATLLAERAAGGISERVDQTPAFETLGVVVDMSSNAAMKPSAIKRFCRLLASEGYDCLMLKTFKGAALTADADRSVLLGRYSEAELTELDAYAASLGIALTPYIQLSELVSLGDTESFCEKMDEALCAYSEILSSRRICFGFDRPRLAGCEKYPNIGDVAENDTFTERFRALSELCGKYGYEATVGGDVLDHIDGTEQSFTYAVSECTSVDRNKYRELIEKLGERAENVGFVGGDNGWYGAVPLSWLSHTVACATIPVLLEKTPKQVYVAMWRDDTAACSYFATLPVLFAYGETCWARTDYTEHLSKRMLSVCGVDFYDMVPLEDIPAIRCRLNTGRTIVTPGRYMLYDKVIGGAYDYHSTGGVNHLKNITVWMAERIERAGEFAYVFESQVAFSNILATKADISETLRRAFRKNWPHVIGEIYSENFEKATDAVDKFLATLEKQWERECMDFGMELIRERAKLVKRRIMEGKPLVGEYLAGNESALDMLKIPPVPCKYDAELIHDQAAVLLSDFDMINDAIE